MSKIIHLPREGVKMQSAARADGWLNTLTGIGTTRDKRLSGAFTVNILDPDSCEELYRSDDMAARIAEAIPEEMTREWVELRVEDDQETAEDVMQVVDDLGLQEAFRDALSIARALGGAGIVLGLNDGQNPELPVNWERVTELQYATVMDCRELIPMSWYRDPLDPRCGLPELYMLRPIVPNATIITAQMSNAYIHETRILRFDGVRTTRRQRLSNRGWGESIYARVYEVLRDYNLSWASAANLMSDFAQGFLKVKGLAELIATNEDDKIIQRAQLMDLSRSVARMVLLDSEEEFGRETTSMGGIDTMLDKFAVRLAAAARMPVTLLMGQSPAGLNATGESDIRFFYDQVAALQRKHILPALKKLTPVLFSTAKKTLPETWSWEFKPLWQMTAKEQAELRNLQATTDATYINAQVVTPEEIAMSRFGGDAYSTETTIDVEAREKMAQSRLEQQAAGLEQTANAPVAPEPGKNPGEKEEAPKSGAGERQDGDVEGHPFRGNQYVNVEGEGSKVGKGRRLWQGQGSIPKETGKFALTKSQTADVGERMAVAYLTKNGFKGARRVHAGRGHNDEFDVVTDTHYVEVKTGVGWTTNAKWKLSFDGHETAKIMERYGLTTSEANEALVEASYQRKVKLAKKHGKKMMTIGIILDPRNGKADIHEFDGIHKSITYASDQAERGFRGTHRYTESARPQRPGRRRVRR